MSDAGGHWNSLAEAQKLATVTLIPGVFETDIKRNNPLELFPVAQAANTGTEIDWIFEGTGVEGDVENKTVGSVLAWSEGVTYTKKTAQLAIKSVQRKLDNFVASIYGNRNNYEAQKLLEMVKGVKRKIGDSLIYDDLTYGTLEYDGLHAWAYDLGASTDRDIDNGEAGLSLANLRKLDDAMKLGIDFYLMPFEVLRNFNAAYEEKGFVGLASGTAGSLRSLITAGTNEIGKRVLYWNGTPIIPTDYLVAEQANTGAGSDKRAKYTSGTKNYSIFAVKKGQVMAGEPGMTMAFGGTEGMGELFKVTPFDKLEDYDAKGLRLTSYIAMLAGGPFAIGRIRDIYDTAITV